MSESSERIDQGIDSEEAQTQDREAVEQDRSEVREFVKQLSGDDIKSGGWFTKLLAHSLNAYTEKVDGNYFKQRYRGVPADAIVDQRIKIASRYAAIEGGLSASAYTATVAATIGSLGGASPATVPAAVVTLMVDVVYITQLQLRLAYDIAILYRVPLDLDDPEDLWKLIRVAFTIKSGEVAREGVVKVVPIAVRPLIKRYYARGVLGAAKSLPIVGKFLLQRNIIKIGIPLVGIPLSVGVNRYTTQIAGRHAERVFRNEARITEAAQKLSERSNHPQLALWVAWLVIKSDGKISDEEALLFKHLVRIFGEEHGIDDEELTQSINVAEEDVLARVAAESGNLESIVALAMTVAGVDRSPNKEEKEVIAKIEKLALRQGW